MMSRKLSRSTMSELLLSLVCEARSPELFPNLDARGTLGGHLGAKERGYPQQQTKDQPT